MSLVIRDMLSVLARKGKTSVGLGGEDFKKNL